MKKFDAVIVYADTYAYSPNDKNYKENAPFSRHSQYEEYIASYEYLIEEARRNNMNMAFVCIQDIVGPGIFKGYWTFEKKWKRNHGFGESYVIFDRYNIRIKKQRKKITLLKSSDKVHTFINRGLKKIFNDKYETYNKFSDFSIPSVEVNDIDKKSIKKAIGALEKNISRHKNKADFGNTFVLKDRFGGGGKNIQYIKSQNDISAIVDTYKYKDISFIIQPYVYFKNSIPVRDFRGYVEMRTVIFNGKVLSAWVRLGPEGCANYDKKSGETRIPMSIAEYPYNVRSKIYKIQQFLPKSKALYTLDFILSVNGNAYLLEGNSSPGLGWDKTRPDDEENKKMVIRAIVDELKRMVEKSVIDDREWVVPKTISNIPVFADGPQGTRTQLAVKEA